MIDNKFYLRKIKKSDLQKYKEEVHYYDDPEYKYNTDTTSKYQAKLDKANLVVDDAQNHISEIKNPKTKAKLEPKILKQAEVRSAKLKTKAETYKTKRLARIERLKPKWQKINNLHNDLNKPKQIVTEKN
jgi:PTS system cellobiose-specific IIC component